MTTHITEETIRSAKAIAHELGWSLSTFHRLKGQLPLYKGCAGGKTSRFEITREDLEAYKRARRAKA